MTTRSEFDHCLNNVAMQFRRPGGRNPWLQPQDVAAAREHVRYGELLSAFEAAAARDGLTRDHLRGGAMLLFEACGYERIPHQLDKGAA